MSERASLFTAIQRRLYAVPDADRHDYPHAVRAMQEALSPEAVCALLDVAEAAKAIYEINALTEPMRIAEAKLLLQSPFRKLGLIAE